MRKFYVKLWMPALEMHVVFVERDSWDEIVAVYRGLADAGLDAVIGRNSGLFDDEEERG